MYFSNVSTGFTETITKHNLTNIFDTNHIYFRDTNYSYNKIDSFVTKHIRIVDHQGMIQKESKNNDIVDITDLKNGKYTITVQYTFAVPTLYTNFIQDLEKKYEIRIENREKAILGIRTGAYEEAGFGKVTKRRETKSNIYFPQYIKILDVTGDIYYQTPFYPPFANGLFYQMGSIENNSTKTIKIEVEVKR